MRPWPTVMAAYSTKHVHGSRPYGIVAESLFRGITSSPLPPNIVAIVAREPIPNGNVYRPKIFVMPVMWRLHTTRKLFTVPTLWSKAERYDFQSCTGAKT